MLLSCALSVANATTDDRDKCRQVGMNDFLTKPICLEELSRVMHHALEKSNTAERRRGTKQTGCWTNHDQLGMLSLDCANK